MTDDLGISFRTIGILGIVADRAILLGFRSCVESPIFVQIA